jgi:hypothetical protein
MHSTLNINTSYKHIIPLPMSDTRLAYKAAHEQFVSNHDGSSFLELCYCLSLLSPLLVVLKVLQGCGRPAFVREFLVVSLPLLLCLTVR